MGIILSKRIDFHCKINQISLKRQPSAIEQIEMELWNRFHICESKSKKKINKWQLVLKKKNELTHSSIPFHQLFVVCLIFYICCKILHLLLLFVVLPKIAYLVVKKRKIMTKRWFAWSASTVFHRNWRKHHTHKNGDAGLCMFVYARECFCVCVLVCRYSLSARTKMWQTNKQTSKYKNKNHNSSLFHQKKKNCRANYTSKRNNSGVWSIISKYNNLNICSLFTQSKHNLIFIFGLRVSECCFFFRKKRPISIVNKSCTSAKPLCVCIHVCICVCMPVRLNSLILFVPHTFFVSHHTLSRSPSLAQLYGTKNMYRLGNG